MINIMQSRQLLRHHGSLFRLGGGLFGVGVVFGSSLLNDGASSAKCHEDTAAAACGCRRRRRELESFLRRSDRKKEDLGRLPTYTSEQVAQRDGVKNEAIWMSYGGYVYDVTTFIPLHPGGTARIRRAAGAAMEKYWYLHTQHFRTEEPMQILSRLVVGQLEEKDQDRIDDEVDALQEKMDSFRLECISKNNGMRHYFTLDDLQKLTKTDIESQVGCESKGGPRQTSFFAGVLLDDLMVELGLENSKGIELVFEAMDGEAARIDSGASLNDILIAYEENGAPLSQGRGFPLRVIIPGKRVIKWVKRIEIH